MTNPFPGRLLAIANDLFAQKRFFLYLHPPEGQCQFSGFGKQTPEFRRSYRKSLEAGYRFDGMIRFGRHQHLKVEHVARQEHVQDLTPAILERLVPNGPAFLDNQHAIHFLAGIDDFGIFLEMLVSSVDLHDDLVVRIIKIGVKRYPPKQCFARH